MMGVPAWPDGMAWHGWVLLLLRAIPTDRRTLCCENVAVLFLSANTTASTAGNIWLKLSRFAIFRPAQRRNNIDCIRGSKIFNAAATRPPLACWLCEFAPWCARSQPAPLARFYSPRLMLIPAKGSCTMNLR
jgi:hypothetical protein